MGSIAPVSLATRSSDGVTAKLSLSPTPRFAGQPTFAHWLRRLTDRIATAGQVEHVGLESLDGVLLHSVAYLREALEQSHSGAKLKWQQLPRQDSQQAYVPICAKPQAIPCRALRGRCHHARPPDNAQGGLPLVPHATSQVISTCFFGLFICHGLSM